jgi:putative ABC transport system permease protein
VRYLSLIWAGVWRKPARTIFTFLSIVVAFLLFGMLRGVNSSLNQVVDAGRLNVLITANPGGLSLPLAQLSQIEAIPGVAGASYRSMFTGYFQLPINGNFMPVFAVDPRNALLTMPPDARLPASQLENFKRTRTGALISARLAQRFHWKIGDHVPLRAVNVVKKDGSAVWAFDIVGIFATPTNPAQMALVMDYQYFDGERAGDNGTVQFYVEKIADAAQATAIGNAIDGRFVNSANQTHTDTERGYAQAQLSEIGDLEFFIDAIVGAAFATLLMLTGSNMMQSFRDRTKEFAVMKTIGFPDGVVATLVLCEATLLCVSAATMGLLTAAVLLARLGNVSGGDVPPVELSWAVVLYGIAAAALIALASTLPAAWRAKRLTIVAALVAH